jgi:conjugative relaxase-like TrwC/TraI family protein
MRIMGAESVAYHRETVMERADDQPGSALGYYASQGETPLRWGGTGAETFGLVGVVTEGQYDAIYGPGGATHPTTGERLVRATRPGMELVISAHKSVAELGVIGRAEDMHAIMDAERDATLGYLDEVTRRRGGRRGEAAVATPTSGLVYSVTRHATSRAGDPCPHDHVLLANLVEMLDAKGGYKGAHTALWRDHLHAATIAGRWAGAEKARELGYAVVPDRGPSDRLGHWAVAGIPESVMVNHSKRAAQIQAECDAQGSDSYQARQVAARSTRRRKAHLAPEDLMARWRSENEALGWPVDALAAAVDAAAGDPELVAQPLDAAAVAAELLGPDGRLAERKVFTRLDVMVAVAATHPEAYGLPRAELDRIVDRVLADPDAIPLLGRTTSGERAHATATTIANEQAVAAAVEAQVQRTTAVRVAHPFTVGAAIIEKGRELGRPLTAGQVAAVQGICASGRGVDLIEGVAGAGKTTVMAVARRAFEAEGFTVIGTATSGQAARTLGREAGIAAAHTVASLRWRLDHDRLHLDERTVVIHDEAGMTDDADVAALLEAAAVAGAKVVMVGDDRQLGAIGSGGSLGALVERHGGTVHRLSENVRQQDPGERDALDQLRSGDIAKAVDWYLANGRVLVEARHDDRLNRMVDGWAADALAGNDAAMFAYRRKNVADLNDRARQRWDAAGRLSGPELVAPGGARYQAGDRIVTLASGAAGTVVTSERGTVEAVDPAAGSLRVRMEDGRAHDFTAEDAGADRLAHGYAVTVHRSQGATVDVAHALEDGGGRELAYVRMSRARQATTVYLVADNLDQAAEDLRREWPRQKRWLWAIDTNTPDPERTRQATGAAVSVQVPPALRRAQLVNRRDAVLVAIPPDVTGQISDSANQIHEVRRALDNLKAGTGSYAGTAAGAAARDLAEAHRRWSAARRMLRSPGLSRKGRREWQENQTRWAQAAGAAQDRWDQHGAPVLTSLTERHQALMDRHDGIIRIDDDRHAWLAAHPELPRLLARLNREVTAIDDSLARQRRNLDGTQVGNRRAVGDTQRDQRRRDRDVGL